MGGTGGSPETAAAERPGVRLHLGCMLGAKISHLFYYWKQCLIQDEASKIERTSGDRTHLYRKSCFIKGYRRQEYPVFVILSTLSKGLSL